MNLYEHKGLAVFSNNAYPIYHNPDYEEEDGELCVSRKDRKKPVKWSFLWKKPVGYTFDLATYEGPGLGCEGHKNSTIVAKVNGGEDDGIWIDMTPKEYRQLTQNLGERWYGDFNPNVEVAINLGSMFALFMAGLVTLDALGFGPAPERSRLRRLFSKRSANQKKRS